MYSMTYTKEYPDGSSNLGKSKPMEKSLAEALAEEAEGKKYLGHGNPFIARDCRVSKIK